MIGTCARKKCARGTRRTDHRLRRGWWHQDASVWIGSVSPSRRICPTPGTASISPECLVRPPVRPGTGTAVGHLEQALWSRSGPGEHALTVAEQFAFHRFLIKPTAVHGHERHVARGSVEKGATSSLPVRSRRSAPWRRWGDGRDQSVDGLHGGRVPDQHRLAFRRLTRVCRARVLLVSRASAMPRIASISASLHGLVM